MKQVTCISGEIMGYKDLLLPEEWKMLQIAFAAMFKKIAYADGKIDKKESKALEAILKKSVKLKCSFAQEVLSSIESSESVMSELESSGLSIRDVLMNVDKILDQKVENADALSFKKHLVAFGVFIGNASGSIFDYNMSHDEMDSLREAGKWLDISVKDLEQTNILLDILNSIAE